MKDYLTTPWNIHYNVDSTGGFNKESCTKIAYAVISDEFRDKLDSMYDAGSALITNNLKDMQESHYFIESIGRESNCISVVFKRSELCWDLKQDEIIDILNDIFRIITNIIDKWICEHDPSDIIPLYTSGLRYKPDSMYGMILDIGISYTRKECSYSIIFDSDMYNEYVCTQKKYFRYILSKIMKANNILFINNQSAVVVIDRNTGIGPDTDRANAIACAAMFATDAIINTTSLMKGEL